MAQKKAKRRKKAGLPPGSLIHVGERKAENATIGLIQYNEHEFSEYEHASLAKAIETLNPEKVSWLNIDGLHDTELIGAAGEKYGLHPLLLEDVLNTDHRPKMEEYDGHIFISLKMISVNDEKNGFDSEQLSFILGDNWLVTFQEKPGDVFDDIRLRMRENLGVVRQKKADYLLYRLIDTVVDHYFLVIEHITDTAEELEKKVLESTDKQLLQEIQDFKKELMSLKRIIFPLREVVSLIQKDESSLIEKSTLRYFRDVYEHLIQINDTISSSRETAANIMDLYLTGVNNKMNEVMKVLTMISTIFIPLSFVVGLYGMNFDNIPELHYEYGYFAVWAFFIVAVSGMIYFFRRKKWL